MQKRNSLPQVNNQKTSTFSLLELNGMKEITEKDYRDFIKSHQFVVIENVKVPLSKEYKIEKFEPENFKLERTTVWSFPDRGDWATHKGNYRANWSPYIPRNLILR